MSIFLIRMPLHFLISPRSSEIIFHRRNHKQKMMSPASSSGKSSPPPSPQANYNKRPHSDSNYENKSFDQKKLMMSGSEGLPQFLRKKIAFREATHSESLKGLVGKNNNSATDKASSVPAYVSYAKNAKIPVATTSNQVSTPQSSKRDQKFGFKAEEIDLFPRERLEPFLKWSKIRSIGPGLINMGNTCFLNSVLQCLFYTTPLAEFLLSKEHSKRCRASKDQFCGVCVLERLMQKVHRQGESVLRPIELVSRIKAVGKHFRPGRQEDSHEFLRLFIETMQKASLGNNETVKLDPRSKETTVIHRIFGGYLQSTVTCSSCRHVSRTFDQFLDLSLDVNKSETLSSAFKVFTTPELLSKGNRYKCEACHRLVEAHKQFTIYKTPEILTIQLKRFSVNLFTGQTSKLNRPVNFPENLNISEWMSDKNSGESCQYRLYGVIVHEGHSCNSGHYHAFVRNSTNIWYSMNDCSVHQVGLDTVLRQRAYILFYQKQSKLEEAEIDIMTTEKDIAINQQQQPPKKQQRTMEEKMAAVKEASRIYTKEKQIIDTKAEIIKSKNNTSQSETKPYAPESEEKEEEIPQLVLAITSELRASSMWHMMPLTESFNSHPPVSSKRIKYNFHTSWQVKQIE
jgi:ubiquitin C-terminal hydrolase